VSRFDFPYVREIADAKKKYPKLDERKEKWSKNSAEI